MSSIYYKQAYQTLVDAIFDKKEREKLTTQDLMDLLHTASTNISRIKRNTDPNNHTSIQQLMKWCDKLGIAYSITTCDINQPLEKE